MHLGDQRSPALSCWHHLAPNDLDCVSPGPVPGAHVAVALRDGRAHGEVPVLAVHVVCSRPRVVPGKKKCGEKRPKSKELTPQPDSEVLDLQGLLFSDFLHRHNLSSGLLELSQLSKEVPEPGK